MKTDIGPGNIWQTYLPKITAQYNPVIDANEEIKGAYKVIGDTLELNFSMTIKAPGSNSGSGAYLIGIPSGLRINTSVSGYFNPIGARLLDYMGEHSIPLGTATVFAAVGTGITVHNAYVLSVDETHVAIFMGYYTDSTGLHPYNSLWSDTVFPLSTQNAVIKFTAKIPVY